MVRIQAIPTHYEGVRFRSRLEAKWAAFFDLMGWPWTYEPFDLEGYIPDFTIDFDRPVLVEVKPYTTTEEICDDPERARVRVDLAAGWAHEVLLVGTKIWDEPCGNGYYTLGLLRDELGRWGKAFPFHCVDCGEPSFAHADAGWHCRRKGCGYGSEHIDVLTQPFAADFREAANRVQWRRPG